MVGLIPMGRLSDHLGKKWFLVGGFGLFAIGLSCISGSRSLGSGLLWAVLLGLSYSSVLPAWNALLAAQVSTQQQSVSRGFFPAWKGLA